MVENLVNNFAMTDDAAQALLSTFNNMMRSMGLSKETSAALSGSMATLAADMANFARIPVEQAASDLQAALMGNTKALRDYGIVIDDAKIKQEALAQGLGNTKGELTAIEKAFVMNNLIMKETKDMVGSVAREQDSYAVTSKKFQAELNSIGDTIGGFLLPKISDVLKLFKLLPDAVKVVTVALPPLVAAITALGGPVVAVVAAVTALSYAASQLYKVWADSNEITVEYAQKIDSMDKAKALLARTEEKLTEASVKQQAAYKTAMELGTQAAWAKEQEATKEEMRLKGIRNLLNGKIADYQKEVDAANKAANDKLKAEADAAAKSARIEEQRLAKIEKAKKDAEEAAKKEAQRQIDIQTFIKEASIGIITNEIQQKKAKLQQWYVEKQALVKGNAKAEHLLESQRNILLAEIDKQALDQRIAVTKAANDEILAEEEKVQQARQQSLAQFQNDITSITGSLTSLSSMSVNKAQEELDYQTKIRDELVKTGKLKEGIETDGMKAAQKRMKEAKSQALGMYRLDKAASIAVATMKGYEAAVNSFAFGTKAGGPALGFALAAISTIATGLQIANIAATPPPFQTAYEQTRTVPGPSNSTMLATLHGGETVSRGNSPTSLLISIDDSGNDLISAIARSLRIYQKQTGFELTPA